MSTLSLRDLLVRETFLARFSWAVQDYPKPDRLVGELRRELTATAADVGMRRAVADLGHPRVLAEGYLASLDRRVPRWATGATWAALAVGAVAYLLVAYAFGTLDTLEDLGGGSVTRTALGATTVYTSTASRARATRRRSASRAGSPRARTRRSTRTTSRSPVSRRPSRARRSMGGPPG